MAKKVWFITGSSRGFGREWAEAALARGDSVAATARDAGTLSDLVERYGEQILALQLDVTDRAADFAAIAAPTSTSGSVLPKGKTGATGAAILQVVDAEQPPLRVFFGSPPLGIAKDRYAQRLATWEQWSALSNAAQG
jgi:NAD(P)-dependent dehydrogenase (short-subunit alcohol dehydrogenase family)